MFKEKSHHVLVLCTLFTITSAVLQYLYPALSFFDGGLIIAILLTVFLKHDHYTRLFGAISVALVIIASFYHPGSADQHRQLILQHAVFPRRCRTGHAFVLYVKKLYRSIESDQHQVKALFDHATEGIILTDDHGKIVLLNPAA
jgi:PAS domain-containing protein